MTARQGQVWLEVCSRQGETLMIDLWPRSAEHCSAPSLVHGVPLRSLERVLLWENNICCTAKQCPLG